MELYSVGNKWINDMKPRELAKTDLEATKELLFELRIYFVLISSLSKPFLPKTAERIAKDL
jgi:methionyl-tRNA synthetase